MCPSIRRAERPSIAQFPGTRTDTERLLDMEPSFIDRFELGQIIEMSQASEPPNQRQQLPAIAECGFQGQVGRSIRSGMI